LYIFFEGGHVSYVTDIPIDVPDGESGDWKVTTFTVNDEEAKRFNLANLFGGVHGRDIKPGTYKKLTCKGRGIIMSNTPAEIRDHNYFIYKATGSVLINGLGLGVVLKAILAKPEVTSVTVIEKEEDVIKLVAPYYTDPRVTIIHADAYEWKPAKGIKYDYVWHDVWDNICTDNLEGMGKLHRKYGRRTAWQDSWSRDTCIYERRREQRECYGY
jgi:hypothetical protein